MNTSKEEKYLFIIGNDRPIGVCSDNNCPCPQVPIPKGTGYFFIEKRGKGFIANLTCEQGAKLRNLDLKSAHEDARMWWNYGRVPARESIKNFDKNQYAPYENVQFGDLQKQMRESHLRTQKRLVDLEHELYDGTSRDEPQNKFERNEEGYFFKSPKWNDPTYPEVYKPSQVASFLESFPPSKLSAPTKPIYKKPVNRALNIFLIFMAVMSIVMISEGDNIGPNLLLLIGMTVIGSLLYKFNFAGKVSDAEEQFKKQMETYETDLKRHYAKVKNEFNSTQVATWRKEKIKNHLITAERFTSSSKATPKGKAEEYFHNHLIDFFGRSKIFTDVEVGRFDRPYIPDFVYHDSDNNVFVDIEIDEPYALKTREPIHFIGKDDERNNYFISRKWLVVRFSEEQIIRYPERCCKVIYQTLEEINLHDPEIKRRFDYTSELPKFKKWSKDESLDLIENNYRDFILDDVYFSNFQKQTVNQ